MYDLIRQFSNECFEGDTRIHLSIAYKFSLSCDLMRLDSRIKESIVEVETLNSVTFPDNFFRLSLSARERKIGFESSSNFSPPIYFNSAEIVLESIPEEFNKFCYPAAANTLFLDDCIHLESFILKLRCSNYSENREASKKH